MTGEVDMHMCINQAGHNRSAACVDDDGIVGNNRVMLLANSGNAPIFENNHRMVNRLRFVTIQKHPSDYCHRHIGPEVFLRHGRPCYQRGQNKQ